MEFDQLWIGINAENSPWIPSEHQLDILRSASLDPLTVGQRIIEMQDRYVEICDPVVMTMLFVVGDLVQRNPPFRGLSDDDIALINLLTFTGYAISRLVMDMESEPSRFSASLGADRSHELLAQRVRGMDIRLVESNISDETHLALFSATAIGDFEVRAVAADEYIEGLRIGLVYTGFALGVAEHSLISEYFGVREAPVRADQKPTESAPKEIKEPNVTSLHITDAQRYGYLDPFPPPRPALQVSTPDNPWQIPDELEETYGAFPLDRDEASRIIKESALDPVRCVATAAHMAIKASVNEYLYWEPHDRLSIEDRHSAENLTLSGYLLGRLCFDNLAAPLSIPSNLDDQFLCEAIALRVSGIQSSDIDKLLTGLAAEIAQEICDTAVFEFEIPNRSGDDRFFRTHLFQNGVAIALAETALARGLEDLKLSEDISLSRLESARRAERYAAGDIQISPELSAAALSFLTLGKSYGSIFEDMNFADHLLMSFRSDKSFPRSVRKSLHTNARGFPMLGVWLLCKLLNTARAADDLGVIRSHVHRTLVATLLPKAYPAVTDDEINEALDYASVFTAFPRHRGKAINSVVRGRWDVEIVRGVIGPLPPAPSPSDFSGYMKDQILITSKLVGLETSVTYMTQTITGHSYWI
jgi:hypothetical protein